jgi:hypothetical protein
MQSWLMFMILPPVAAIWWQASNAYEVRFRYCVRPAL